MEKLNNKLLYLKEAIKHIFLRTSLVEYNFYAGMTQIRECFSVFWAILKREPLLNGSYISKYESVFAHYLGIRYAFSFATGRMGLYVILKALGLKKGDEIIIPAYTCVVVPNAIIYAGAKPVYVDIDPKTFNIDVAKIEEKITSKTKALYAQHTFGLMCNVEAICKIADKYKIPVIEDCCLALGAERNGKKAGTFGKVAYFSTDHSKVISTSSGGMVTTNDSSLAKRINTIYMKTPFCSKNISFKILFTLIIENILRNPCVYFWGRYLLQILLKCGLIYFFMDYYRTKKPANYPFPARLSNLQAMVGSLQLSLIEKIISHQRFIARQYDKIFCLYPEYFKRALREHIFQRYVFLVENPSIWEKSTRKYLELGIWFSSIAECRHHDFHEIFYNSGACPVAEEVSKHVINLPTHLKIKNPKIIINMVKKILQTEKLKHIRL